MSPIGGRALVAVLALAACSSASAPPAPEGSSAQPVRPDVPADWQVMVDEATGVGAALPPDFQRVQGMGGVSAQSVARRGAFTMEVHAARAREMQPARPWTDEAVTEWLMQQATSWVGGELAGSSSRRVALPAGEAVEIRGRLTIDGPEPIEIVAYAVPTESGLADLHILALASVAEERADEIELIPQLWVLDGG